MINVNNCHFYKSTFPHFWRILFYASIIYWPHILSTHDDVGNHEYSFMFRLKGIMIFVHIPSTIQIIDRRRI